MISQVNSLYHDILFEKINDVSKLTEMFNSNKISAKYDYFNSYVKDHNDQSIFTIVNDEQIIGIMALYNEDTVNKNICIYGILFENRYYQYLFKAFISFMNHAFVNLNVNKLNLIFRYDNYFFEDICRALFFVKEGVLRNYLYDEPKYCDVSIYSMLSYEYSRLTSGNFKKLYTWDYDFNMNNFVQLDICGLMNNRAFSNGISNGNSAEINTLGEFSLNKSELYSTYLVYKTVKFKVNIFDSAQKYDNIVCKNQEIEVTLGCYSDLLIIGLAQFGYQKSKMTLLFSDNGER